MSESKKFIKFLKDIGVPVSKSISPESLNVVLLHKPAKQFFHGISSTMTANNVLSNEDILAEKEMEEFGIESDENLEDLQISLAAEEAELLDSMTYLNQLEEENLQLLQIDGSTSCSNDVKLNTQKEIEALSECKATVDQFKEELSCLEKYCSELHSLSCDKNKPPFMLYHLSLDSYFAERKLFDTAVKHFLIKQFEKRMFVLSGLNEPVPSIQRDPRSLMYFIAGPCKEQYEKQCNAMSKLQVKYASVLCNSKILDAKIVGLEAAIKLIENWEKPSSASDKTKTVQELKLKVAEQESLLYPKISKKISNEIETIVIGNIKIKERRQKYYLEKLSKLEKLLKQQYNLDQLVFVMTGMEKYLIGEVQSLFEFVDRMFQPEVDDTVSEDLKSMKIEENGVDYQNVSSVDPKLVNGDSGLQSDSSELTDIDVADAFAINHLVHMDDTLDAAFKRILECRDIQSRLLSEPESQKHSLELEPELEQRHNQLVSLLTEYNREMTRREQFPLLHIMSGLWAVFVNNPEKFNDIA